MTTTTADEVTEPSYRRTWSVDLPNGANVRFSIPRDLIEDLGAVDTAVVLRLVADDLEQSGRDTPRPVRHTTMWRRPRETIAPKGNRS